MYLKGLFYYYTVHGCFFSYFQKWLPKTDFKALGTVPFVFSLPQMMLRSMNTSIFGHQLVLFYPLPRYWWIGFMTPIYQSKLHTVIDLCCGFGIVNVVHSFNIQGLKPMTDWIYIILNKMPYCQKTMANYWMQILQVKNTCLVTELPDSCKQVII